MSRASSRAARPDDESRGGAQLIADMLVAHVRAETPVASVLIEHGRVRGTVSRDGR